MIARVSKSLAFTFVKTNQVFADSVVIIPSDEFSVFSVLQSHVHNSWVWTFCTTMKTDPNYGVSKVLQNFPLPLNYKTSVALLDVGQELFVCREKLLKELNIGLSKLEKFNNNPEYNSLSFSQYRICLENNDMAVLYSYGWLDISLRHGFYEVDYLPENDRVRYTIHPDARKEVLKRLLLLNHERFEKEVANGLHKKKDVVAFYQQKGTEIPENTVFSDGKKKPVIRKKVTKVEEPKEQYGLFNEVASEVKENSQVSVKNEKGDVFKYHIYKNAVKGNFTDGFKQIATSSTLAEIMLGRKVGDSFVFGGVKYVVLEVI